MNSYKNMNMNNNSNNSNSSSNNNNMNNNNNNNNNNKENNKNKKNKKKKKNNNKHLTAQKRNAAENLHPETIPYAENDRLVWCRSSTMSSLIEQQAMVGRGT